MRILTIGPSPYLLEKIGRIHRDIIDHLSKGGHHVDSIVWHHDVEYFMPTQTGKHLYNGVQMYPFLGPQGQLAPMAFEVMKETHPTVVVSVGEYDETDWLWSLKSLYPHLFKWVAVIPSGTDVVSEKNRLALGYADAIITTTRAAERAFKVVKTETRYVPYGPCHKTFHPTDSAPSELKLLNMGKNAQTSNVPAFLKAVAQTGFKATLHTNIDDGGDYDIRSLLKRYGIENQVSLPEKYVSVREGLTDCLVNELYNGHHAVVDCSLQSQTALTLLEAMSTGCIPVGMSFGAAGEVLAAMPAEFRFSVPFETFVGPREEEFAIISVKGLVQSIWNIHKITLLDSNWLGRARQASSDTARIFSKDLFVTRVSETLERVVTSENSIAVDSF